jgi:hypothetical protein
VPRVVNKPWLDVEISGVAFLVKVKRSDIDRIALIGAIVREKNVVLQVERCLGFGPETEER